MQKINGICGYRTDESDKCTIYKDNLIQVHVGPLSLPALVDSGSNITAISESLFNKIRSKTKIPKRVSSINSAQTVSGKEQPLM